MSRAAFEVEGNGSFEKAVREAAKWMRKRCPSIPADGLNGTPFRIGGGGENHAEAVAMDYDGGRLWSSTLDFPDENASRTWVTEITVGEHRGRTAFGARLLNVTRGEDFPFVASRPGIVRQVLATCGGMADGENLGEAVWEVNTPREFEAFLTLLTNSDRALPLLAMTTGQNGDTSVSSSTMAGRLSGVAHLVNLGEEQAWELTRRLGKRLSVFGGGTRLYRPHFTPTSGTPFDQPLWLSRPTDSAVDLDERAQHIINVVCGISVRPAQGTDFPRFSEVQRAAAEKASIKLKSEGGSSDLLALYEDEITNLKAALERQKSEHDELLAMADSERQSAVETADEVRVDLTGLRARLAGLEAALARRDDTPLDQPLERYDDIESWANGHLSGDIWLAPKAIKETERKAEFRDPQLLGKALLCLRDFYIPMRRSPGSELRASYDEALELLHLKDEPCMTNKDNVRTDPAYSLRYRGERFWCENHIKYGGGTDPRAFFRIYYHWHEEEQILLIGHMPTHLDNSMTN